MSESFPFGRRKGDMSHDGLSLQAELEVRRLLSLPRVEREVKLQQQITEVEAIKKTTWEDLIGYLSNIMSKDALLFPDEDSPLICYPSATFALDHYVPVTDYFVQPRLVHHKDTKGYEKFLDYLGDLPGEVFEDIDFIKAIPGLAVAFSFYVRTDIKYSPELDTTDMLAVDSEGYVVIPDRRLDFVIAKPEPLGILDHLSIYTERSPEYELQFKNIYLFMKRERINATIQADVMRQLAKNDYIKVADFGIREPDSCIPAEEHRYYSDSLGNTDIYFPDDIDPS